MADCTGDDYCSSDESLPELVSDTSDTNSGDFWAEISKGLSEIPDFQVPDSKCSDATSPGSISFLGRRYSEIELLENFEPIPSFFFQEFEDYTCSFPLFEFSNPYFGNSENGIRADTVTADILSRLPAREGGRRRETVWF